ncbi:MAG: hypothetical protein OHK0053_09050 [Microscillaceae bacterium]
MREQAYLDSLKVKRLYLRFFDVDWHARRQQAAPIGLLRLSAQAPTLPQLTEIVPTFFITQRTLQNLPDSAVTALAQQMAQKCMALARSPRFKATFPRAIFPEFQLDCDWTAGTRAKYFRLLKAFQAQMPTSARLSHTLRLHQYRHPQQTGVAPTNRAALMFYNMGELDDSLQNSILNLEVARAYLQRPQPYPQPLDIALPLFSWAVVYRNGQVLNLLAGLDEATCRQNPAFKPQKESWFIVQKNHYYHGIYFYKGDRLKIERIFPEALAEAYRMLKQRLRPMPTRIIFFHLSPEIVHHFPAALLWKKLQE